MRRSRFGTSGLLLCAFASILVTFACAGFAIERQAELVHSQTREIMENGLPSIVSATRMKELLPSLREGAASQPDPIVELRYDSAAERFRQIISHERGANIAFPDERATLDDIGQRFESLVADARAARSAGPEPAAERRVRELRYQEAWSALAIACERFEALNQGGIHLAETSLNEVSAQEERLLGLGVLGCLVFALGWGLYLTRRIATPLRALERAIARLPAKASRLDLSELPPAAIEIQTLATSLQELTSRLVEAGAQQAVAQHELHEALAREGVLNRDLARVNSSLDRQVQIKTEALEAANARLSDLNGELQLRDRSRSSFLAAVSHELRTPIAVMKASMLTLRDLTLAPEAEARLLTSAAEEADHLATLVDDLLDVARMDTGKFRIVPTPGVALGGVVEAVRAGLSTLFEDQEVGLACEVAPGLPALTADAERLRQVLRNLLENAARYSPPGTTVVIAAWRAGDRLEVEVRDEGMGVAAASAATLFMPFGQRDPRVPGGVGLGLAIARQLVVAHGGELSYRPNPGPGSTFAFWLPVEPAS